QRILVIEPDDEPEREQAIGECVDERPSELLHPKGVAHRVNDGTGRQPILRDLPQFLDAKRLQLRRPALVQSERPDERLGEIPSNAVTEDRDFRADVDARLVRALALAMLVDAP